MMNIFNNLLIIVRTDMRNLFGENKPNKPNKSLDVDRYLILQVNL